MEGKGGMPSLSETLKGHRRAGHEIVLVLPKYHLFTDEAEPLRVPSEAAYPVFLAPCGWVPVLKQLRAAGRFVSGGRELLYPVRWVLNLATMLLLTVSLVAAAARVRYRRGLAFDLIYAHNQYAALAGFLLGAMWRIPNVTRLYGTFLADLMEKPLVWLRYPTASAGYLVPHSLLICGNDGTRGDEVARKLGIELSKFRFWQNGVDRPEADPSWSREGLAAAAPENLRPEAKWLVSCSRLSYWKRMDRVLRAFRHCREACPDAQLLVAGDGPERDRLHRLAEELGVAEDVVWLGGVPHEDVWRLMHLADVFVIANDVTNRCNPVYEAIRAGLPIVSIHDRSTEDLLADGANALLADPDDEAALGGAMARACSDESLATKLREGQRRLSADLWTWRERMAEEVREMERLVAGGGRRRSDRRGGPTPGTDSEGRTDAA
jgi:glycosyltransferase involved in cell wall biosynthesis